jgi:CRISPR/Cas system CMR subunit Cmr6 (Cas7 group RAMP superfamily)
LNTDDLSDAQQQQGTQDAAHPPSPPLSEKKEASDDAADPKADKDSPRAQTPPKTRWQRFRTWVWPMEFSDAVMIGLTFFIAFGTLVSAAAIYMQWREMVNGGTDTTAIRVAAQKQAGASQQFADTAVLISGGISNAVNELDAQAKATQKSANTAKNAADIANKALHISERAYIVVGLPTIDTTTKYITLPIVNTGHIPSGKVKGIVHEATIDGVDPNSLSIRINPTETHWKHYELESVPTTGQTMNFSVPIPALNAENLNSGHQQIIIVGVIIYNDGFPDDAEQQWPFCYGNAMLAQSKNLQWVVCDSNLYLPEVIKEDHYPSNEQK